MIAGLVPPGVVAADAFEDHGWDGLYAEERALVQNAVEARKQEFATVRACARAALAGLGLPPAPVLPGRRNVPRWPKGVVGSMTHCAGYRAAAVARTREVHAIGIDAEPNLPLPDGVLESIATAGERAWVSAAPRSGGVHWPRLLFSAKESVYKAWFPLTGTEIDFPDATIHVLAASPSGTTPEGEAAGTFTARMRFQGWTGDGRPVTRFSGRWLARKGIIVTVATLPVIPETALPK
ncbi:4'-phosphopantetheinyl transferase superfamily protein [Streptomyces sp. ISL-94]|uniref:4'-phosphopantetheinyl transferase family protein n=1 Tax=Streptomyces sp. ISL-94 TaxID=2819190 RepID=UPI001BE9F993|nr:4'-phosphopantetheinyl transferase superfamily protein [Streptomyces sp. ISL-94]MBT2479334.1 4'-phosphopantetheinyl transferase superfamily protein [Streptomyces sp. ISL-94]